MTLGQKEPSIAKCLNRRKDPAMKDERVPKGNPVTKVRTDDWLLVIRLKSNSGVNSEWFRPPCLLDYDVSEGDLWK